MAEAMSPVKGTGALCSRSTYTATPMTTPNEVFSTMDDVSQRAKAVPQNKMSMEDPSPVRTPEAISSATRSPVPDSASSTVPAQPMAEAAASVLREM